MPTPATAAWPSPEDFVVEAAGGDKHEDFRCPADAIADNKPPVLASKQEDYATPRRKVMWVGKLHGRQFPVSMER